MQRAALKNFVSKSTNARANHLEAVGNLIRERRELLADFPRLGDLHEGVEQIRLGPAARAAHDQRETVGPGAAGKSQPPVDAAADDDGIKIVVLKHASAADVAPCSADALEAGHKSQQDVSP